ncbi:MAG: DUF4476 domain-containing protein [Bacteroidetes bacterium]|nr:DUF4476 domain-containing protein [Bacteroidota bacterium]
MRIFASLLLVMFVAAVHAQGVAHCTIYNEEGIRFTVYLNGEKMNDTPLDRVRMINLTQNYYKIKVEFDGDSIPPIERKIFQLTNADGVKVDAIHILKRNKKGEWGLHWKSQSVAPRYIEDKPTVVVVNNGVQQTTTTTTTTEPDGNRISFGVPGGHVSINTGGSGASTTRETTTTTTAAAPAAGTAPCTGNILTQNEFADALKSINARSTEDGKLSSAKQVLSANCVNVEMVRSVMKLFTTDDKKLEVAKYAYANTVDKGSYYKLNGEFANESSIDALNSAILK